MNSVCTEYGVHTYKVRSKRGEKEFVEGVRGRSSP